MLRVFVAVVFAFVAVTGTRASAQVLRYELGRRLRLFERAWETADDVARARASVDLNAATMAFFGLNQRLAAQRLDAARFALAAPTPPALAVQVAASLACVPSRRLLDPAVDELRVSVERVYEVEDATDGEARAELSVSFGLQGDGAGVDLERTVGLELAEQGIALDVRGRGAGRLHLRCVIRAGDRRFADASVPIELCDDLAARVEAVSAAAALWMPPPDHDATTLLYLTRALSAAMLGKLGETDLPYLSLLRDAEAIVALNAEGRQFLRTSPRGERWLCLRLGKAVPVRIHAPAADEGPEPRPLLILLHGAGGTENMFFDAYGTGKYVAMARARSWIVAAPGNGGASASELVRALASCYPVDRARVYLVGHSMGAAQAIGAATGARGSDFAAVVALGGGGRVARAAELAGRRFFVGVGAEDFARPGALALGAALLAAGADVTQREYADTEHLGVVQRAAADVFAWLAPPPAGSADLGK